MALQQPKEIVVFFDEVIESFESNNIMATEAGVFRTDARTQQNSNDTIWRPEEQIGDIQKGLDQTGNYGDVLELSVPTRLAQIDNDVFNLDALQLRDRRFMEKRAKASGRKLASGINVALANKVALTGTLVIDLTAAPSGYGDLAQAETRMDQLQIPIDADRKMFLNSTDYAGMAADLAAKQTGTWKLGDDTRSKSMIGDWAGFDTFRTNFLPVQPRSTATITTAGAQFHVPLAFTTAAGEEIPLDNRGMNLEVDTTVGVNLGDSFTVAGVFEVSGIDKQQTPNLRTFRVVDIVDGTNLTIYPRVIPVDQIGTGLTRAQGTYANTNTEIPAATVLSFINTAATGRNTNVFWRQGSVEVVAGELAWDQDLFPGATFMSETLDSGVTLVMMIQGDTRSGVSDIRVTTHYDTVNLCPEQNGILGKFS